MAVFYRHTREDNNNVFYIGISNRNKRAYDFNGRTPAWKYIYNKTDIIVDVVAKDISYEDALELEILLILEYGRRDLKLGNLVNMTDGGEGVLNRIVKQEIRRKISKGNKGKVISEKAKKLISIANKGNKHTEETKLKMSKALKGRIISNYCRKRSSEANKGNTHSVGRIVSDETRQKMRNSSIRHRSRKIIQLTKEGVKIREWESITDAANYYNVSVGSVCSALTGVSKTSCGYKWQYINNG